MLNFSDEMKIEPTELKAEDINMLTCTPVLAGRGLDKSVPQSPFLTANNHARDATPMMRVQIRTNGDSA